MRDEIIILRKKDGETKCKLCDIVLPSEASCLPYEAPEQTYERRENTKVRRVVFLCRKALEAIGALGKDDYAGEVWLDEEIPDLWHLSVALEENGHEKAKAIRELWSLAHDLVAHLRTRLPQLD